MLVALSGMLPDSLEQLKRSPERSLRGRRQHAGDSGQNARAALPYF